MAKRKIRVALLGGGESDLQVFGELHRRRDVEIAFVYDRQPAAVALEIAEILGVPRATRPEEIALLGSVDLVVVAEPRSRYASELAVLGDVEVVDPSHVIARLSEEVSPAPPAAPAAPAPAARPSPSSAPPPPSAASASHGYSLDDALSGFERLFDRSRLLKFLLDVAVEATGAVNGSIMLYSPEADELYIAYASGLSERVVKGTRQKIGEGIAGAVARERKGKLIRETHVGAHYASERDRVNIASACSIPLVTGERLLGVLNVSSTRGARELTVGDLHTLEKLGERIARLLAASLRVQEAQARSGEMNLRRSVGELSEKPGTTAEKFALLAGLVADLTGAESVEVYLGTAGGEWMVLGGSNRRTAHEPEFVRVGRSAMARAYLERRPVVLTEAAAGAADASTASFVFVPLALNELLGVAALEFADRQRLEAFMAVRESVALELSRFIASERRERRLRAELTSLVRVSDAAPALISCRTPEELVDSVARLAADALECTRVSVRLRTRGRAEWVETRFDAAGNSDPAWIEEDRDRFARLDKTREAYHLSVSEFGADGPRRHSVLAVPIREGAELAGGIVAYDRRPATAVDEASFSAHDEAVLEQIIAMAWPVAESFAASGEAARPSYDEMLAGNVHRFARVLDAEMARSDRYHHPFSLVAVRAPALSDLFRRDEARALALVEDIRQGIQTRTRTSDVGCWIKRDLYAMVTLDDPRRVRFLVARIAAYLQKDLAGAGITIAPGAIFVGVVAYPGTARTAEALIEEAEIALLPNVAE